MIFSIVSISLSFLSFTVAAASPQSVGSDLSIVTHNDLYGNATTRPAAAIVLNTQSIYSAATSQCAALGTILWNPESHKQELSFLQYLDHGNSSDDIEHYWIEGNTTSHCRAITTKGEIKSYPCLTPLPALCSNTVTDTVRQVSVTTNNATITGFRDRQAFRFLGLRYASIPARFAQSIYLPPTSNITALEYGPTCIQPRCTYCSEDCLTLNIWTPYLPSGKTIPGKKKAVMLWIYGGGFISGAASDTTFDGNALASRGDVVAVTANYRLGTLGFLALENTTLTGNYGLRDQNTALDWLIANVEAFGGDKDRITIFGQSAGAASVRALLTSPHAHNKVSGAIMMSTPQGSGGPSSGGASAYSNYTTIAKASNVTKSILDETGCSTKDEDVVACLRKVDPMDFVRSGRTVASSPVVDGTFLPISSLPLGSTGPKFNYSILSGTMHDDGSPFTSYPKSTNISEILTSRGFPAAAILNSTAFPIPSNVNSTLALFNLTSRLTTDTQFRCLGQSSSSVAAKNSVFKNVYAYEFDRAYQIEGYSPNPPACEAPVAPGYPFGDPTAPFYKCHSGELYAVFGTTVREGRPIRDEDDVPFSQYIVDTWSAFARTGDPTPDSAYLSARGFTNTTKYVAAAGTWNPVGKTDTPVRVLDVLPRDEGWRELEQCEILGQPLAYYETLQQ